MAGLEDLSCYFYSVGMIKVCKPYSLPSSGVYSIHCPSSKACQGLFSSLCLRCSLDILLLLNSYSSSKLNSGLTSLVPCLSHPYIRFQTPDCSQNLDCCQQSSDHTELHSSVCLSPPPACGTCSDLCDSSL